MGSYGVQDGLVKCIAYVAVPDAVLKSIDELRAAHPFIGTPRSKIGTHCTLWRGFLREERLTQALTQLTEQAFPRATTETMTYVRFSPDALALRLQRTDSLYALHRVVYNVCAPLRDTTKDESFDAPVSTNEQPYFGSSYTPHISIGQWTDESYPPPQSHAWTIDGITVLARRANWEPVATFACDTDMKTDSS
jgi:hypothetical protein